MKNAMLWFGGAIALGGVAFAFGEWAADVEVASRVPLVASAPGVAQREGARDSIRTSPRSEQAMESNAILVSVVDGESELSARWDELSAQQRTDALRRDVVDAVGAMRRGEDWASHRAKADAALSALRPELYVTVEGREEHRALERELEELVEQERRAHRNRRAGGDR